MSASDKTTVNAVKVQKEHIYPLSLEQQKAYAAKKNSDVPFEFDQNGIWTTEVGLSGDDDFFFSKFGGDFFRGAMSFDDAVGEKSLVETYIEGFGEYWSNARRLSAERDQARKELAPLLGKGTEFTEREIKQKEHLESRIKALEQKLGSVFSWLHATLIKNEAMFQSVREQVQIDINWINLGLLWNFDLSKIQEELLLCNIDVDRLDDELTALQGRELSSAEREQRQKVAVQKRVQVEKKAELEKKETELKINILRHVLEKNLGLTAEQAACFIRSMQQNLYGYHKRLMGENKPKFDSNGDLGNIDYTVSFSRQGDKIITKLHTTTDPELCSEFEMLVSDLKIDAEGKATKAPIRLVETRALDPVLKNFILFYGLESLLTEAELTEKIDSMNNENELEQFWFFCTSLGNAVTDNSKSIEVLKKYFLEFHPIQQSQDLQVHNLATVLFFLERIDTTNKKAVFEFMKNILVPYATDAIRRMRESGQNQSLLDILLADAKEQNVGRMKPSLIQAIFNIRQAFENEVCALTPEGQYFFRFAQRGIPTFLRNFEEMSLLSGRNQCPSLPILFRAILTEPDTAVVSVEELKQKTANMNEEKLEEFETFLDVFAEKFNEEVNFNKGPKDFAPRFLGDREAFTAARDAHEERVRSLYKRIVQFKVKDDVEGLTAAQKKKEEVIAAKKIPIQIQNRYTLLAHRQKALTQEKKSLEASSKGLSTARTELDREANRPRSRRGTVLLGIAAVFTFGLALIPVAINNYRRAQKINENRNEILISEKEIFARQENINTSLGKISTEMDELRNTCKENSYIACTDEELQEILSSVDKLCQIEENIENQAEATRKANVKVDMQPKINSLAIDIGPSDDIKDEALSSQLLTKPNSVALSELRPEGEKGAVRSMMKIGMYAHKDNAGAQQNRDLEAEVKAEGEGWNHAVAMANALGVKS